MTRRTRPLSALDRMVQSEDVLFDEMIEDASIAINAGGAFDALVELRLKLIQAQANFVLIMAEIGARKAA